MQEAEIREANLRLANIEMEIRNKNRELKIEKMRHNAIVEEINSRLSALESERRRLRCDIEDAGGLIL